MIARLMFTRFANRAFAAERRRHSFEQFIEGWGVERAGPRARQARPRRGDNGRGSIGGRHASYEFRRPRR